MVTRTEHQRRASEQFVKWTEELRSEAIISTYDPTTVRMLVQIVADRQRG